MPNRRRESLDNYSPEPVVVDRGPQLYHLFRSRKKRIHIIEESPVLSRRTDRDIRTPSPSPPPLPRVPYYAMSSRLRDRIYAPLPPRLPPKEKEREGDCIDHIVEERSPRFRKVKVIHSHPNDEDAYPQVEGLPSRGKRDSGKYYVVEPSGSGGARQECERRRPDPEVQGLVDDLQRERRVRREAEMAATAAKEAADRLKTELLRERRQRSLERRECAIRERERRLSQEPARFVEVRRPRERQDIVVVHNPPQGVPVRDINRSPLDRAREDYRRTHPEHAGQRSATADRRSRRQSVIAIDDERDRDRDRERGWRRR